MKRNENNVDRLVLYAIVLLFVVFVALFNTGCVNDVKYKGPHTSKCDVDKVGTVAYLTCDGKTISIEDGLDGVDGTDAENNVKLVTICPLVKPNHTHKEVLLLVDGTYMAFFTSGHNDRLVVLSDASYGVYRTTDSRYIKFGINGESILCEAP